MKNFVYKYLHGNTTSESGDTYIPGQAMNVYTYTGTSKALLLSLLIKNNTSPATDVTVTTWIYRSNPGVCIYPIISNTILGWKDEFSIDRTHNIFVLYPQDKIRVYFSDSGMWFYCSILENVN